MTTEAYPLYWPHGKPRTQRPTRSRFSTGHYRACQELLNEIRLLGGREPIISTNIPLRRDGLPYANQSQPQDRGVAVYFTLRGKQMCFACDRWDTVHDNIYAIGKTISALRGIERWGTGDMVQQAFTGFVALPAPKNPYDILGVRPNASEDEINTAFKQRAKTAHPDMGGSTIAMQELVEARDKLLEGKAA